VQIGATEALAVGLGDRDGELGGVPAAAKLTKAINLA